MTEDTNYALLRDIPSPTGQACNPNIDHLDLAQAASDDHEMEDKEFYDESQLTSPCESFWNICNTIQGLPILAIPYAIRNGGYVALLALIVIAMASNYTAQTIVRCLYESKDGKRKRVRSSFVEVGQKWNPRFGHHLVLVSEIAQLLFLAAVYPRMVGRMLAKSLPSAQIPCWLWTFIGGVAFIPNIFIQNLSQVAWTSIITVISAKIIFVAIFTYSIMQYLTWELASLDNFDVHTFPAALGILVASYLSQPFVPVIEKSMRKKEQFCMLMNIAYSSMTLLNIIIGVVAYISFRPNTAEVITNSLPEGSFRRVVNIMASLLAFTSYTLPMFTIFDIVQNANLPCMRENFGVKVARADVLAFRLFLVAISILIASLVPRFTYMLAFVGSTAGISLELIFPPMFHVKIYYDSLSWWEIAVDTCVICLGLFFLLSGAFFSGQSLFRTDCCHVTGTEICV